MLIFKLILKANFEAIALLIKATYNPRVAVRLAEVQFVIDSCCLISQSNYVIVL